MRQEATALLAKTSEEQDFRKREKVYQDHREELTMEFRKSNRKNIDKTCRGFFMDPRHLASHFEYLTGSSPLDDSIEANLKTHLGHLEEYLADANKTIEYKKKIQDIELVCEVEFGGSKVLKDIHILRLACEHFDDCDGSKLIRISSDRSNESDPPPDSPSPHIVAVLVDKTFIFELWAEHAKLLGNMNICTALASFFHLAFCFDLKYPKAGETVADLLQRSVASYGDNSGTRTWKRKDTAEKKIEGFYSKLGRLMSKTK